MPGTWADALKNRLPLLAAALWWGSGICLGFIAVPLVFRHAGDVALAARITPQLFAAQSWLALGCGLLLLVMRPRRMQRQDRIRIGLVAHTKNSGESLEKILTFNKLANMKIFKLVLLLYCFTGLAQPKYFS